MKIDLVWNEPIPNCVLWRFSGAVGIVDYLPTMNDSITRAMLNPDENYAMLLDMGWSVPLPNRSFAMIARPIIGAPPNLKRVVIAAANPLTRAVIALTLGREPTLKSTLIVVPSRASADALLTETRRQW